MARPAPARPKTAPRRRREPASRARRRVSTAWPTIETFLESGESQTTVGAIPYSSLHYTASAHDGHTLLVALVRRPRETLHGLMSRLDRALLRALEKQICGSELR